MSSYLAGLFTAPDIKIKFSEGFMNIVSPDLRRGPKLLSPNKKVLYKSSVLIFFPFLIRSIFLYEPSSDGPPETLIA